MDLADLADLAGSPDPPDLPESPDLPDPSKPSKPSKNVPGRPDGTPGAADTVRDRLSSEVGTHGALVTDGDGNGVVDTLRRALPHRELSAASPNSTAVNRSTLITTPKSHPWHPPCAVSDSTRRMS